MPFPRLSPKSFLSLFFCLLAVSASAQKSSGGNRSNGPRPSPSMTSTDYKPMSGEAEFSLYDVTRRDSAVQQKLKNEQPPCFQWPLNPVLSNTVSTGRLDVPGNARDEFIEGCSAAHKKDLAAARQHLERAVKAAPKFAAAWTLLGQVEKIQGQKEEALRSCTNAREGDPSYLPGYLCLAD